jgi:hypothetical protein
MISRTLITSNHSHFMNLIIINNYLYINIIKTFTLNMSFTKPALCYKRG